MKTIAAILLSLMLLVALAPAEDKQAPSTPEERARLIDIAAKLKAEPTNQNLRSDYTWALKFLVETPDVTLEMCTATMPWEKKYKHSGDLAAVELTNMGAFVFQHPEKANDKIAVGIAGLEAAMDSYKKIVAADQKAKSKAMDELLTKQANGTLAAYVQQEWASHCNK
jgi:hypothetical protein